MFRMWVRIWKDGHLLKDTVVEEPGDDTRTHKVMRALEEGCLRFDLPRPIWLDACIKDFQRHSRCRFGKDAFIEDIGFDYLDIRIIEEDD